jgi:pyruvate dehydrogenase E2 component (dihydrolipoamide acetyltransferase)
MATVIELPQLGNTVDECLVTRWFKRKGDAVSAGEAVAEIETDKTTFEITASVDGTVLETFVEAGAIVPVFTKLCVIGDPGEPVSRDRVAGTPPKSANTGAPTPRAAQPLERRPPGGEGGPTPVAPLSPRARRFAAEHDVDVGSLAGSGPGGRVLERDVRKAFEASQAMRSSDTRLSMSRQTIARRTRESLVLTAQYTLHGWAHAGGLIAARARSKMSPRTDDITVNHLLTMCLIRTLKANPAINAQLIDGQLVEHSQVHLAFACDTPRGLMAPVVRDAEQLSLANLAERMQELANQAVRGTLGPDDLAGATFTISNLGALGIESFTPILNPPQVAILGVGAIHVRPLRTAGGIDFIDAIGLSLTCDHQVIDGAPGARFLRALAQEIESVESILSSS